jgi:hypothetical protein
MKQRLITAEVVAEAAVVTAVEKTLVLLLDRHVLVDQI